MTSWSWKSNLKPFIWVESWSSQWRISFTIFIFSSSSWIVNSQFFTNRSRKLKSYLFLARVNIFLLIFINSECLSISSLSVFLFDNKLFLFYRWSLNSMQPSRWRFWILLGKGRLNKISFWKLSCDFNMRSIINHNTNSFQWMLWYPNPDKLDIISKNIASKIGTPSKPLKQKINDYLYSTNRVHSKVNVLA